MTSCHGHGRGRGCGRGHNQGCTSLCSKVDKSRSQRSEQTLQVLIKGVVEAAVVEAVGEGAVAGEGVRSMAGTAEVEEAEDTGPTKQWCGGAPSTTPRTRTTPSAFLFFFDYRGSRVCVCVGGRRRVARGVLAAGAGAGADAGAVAGRLAVSLLSNKNGGQASS